MLEVVKILTLAINVPGILRVERNEEKIAQDVQERYFSQPVAVIAAQGNLLHFVHQQINESDLILVPSSGSRKVFLIHLGDIPERLTQTVAGNVMVLHYPH
jgi:predicted Mrr-cat superfamily restriction endonuclease